MLHLLTAAFVLCALCRFSAAGNDDLTTRSGDRRLKSAKARNRVGRWCAAGAAGGRCRKRLWGFGRQTGLPAIRVGYPARTEMQLKRFGTNIAKWGFHVLSHQEFQGLKPATAARATTSARYASLRALADSIKGHDSTALRQSPFAEPKPFRSSRQDDCRSIARDHIRP